MAENKSAKNAFIVDTTFQLLNAIEASNAPGMLHNHLVIVNEAGQVSPAYRRIIDKGAWEVVSYVWLIIDTNRCEFAQFGTRGTAILRKWYGRYLHLRRLRNAAKIARLVGDVDNLFLGHYWADKKPFMRHFANTIRHNKLFILDDGTDVIDINDRRKLCSQNEGANVRSYAKSGDSALRKLLGPLRKKYWNWNISEAKTVTFFTSYDLDVKVGDHIARNDYRYLRSLAGVASRNDAIVFLGQCLVDDGYMDVAKYLDYLRYVKEYFKWQHIQYVPHPRESAPNVRRVFEAVGFEIRQYDVPIEYELVTGGEMPRIVASFFCSALESCSNIFGDGIKLVCFYIHPVHLKTAQSAVGMIYEYFERKAGPNFVVVKFDDLDSQA